MEINFTKIKNDFASYLSELYDNKGVENNSDIAYNDSIFNSNNGFGGYHSVNSENVNIFEYSNEFKEYIAEELNLDSSILSASLCDVLNEDFLNNKLNEENNKSGNIIIDFLHNLFGNSKFTEQLDTNKNGVLDKEEKDNFFKFISINDNNANNISLSDVLTGIDSVKKGTYNNIQSSNIVGASTPTTSSGSLSSGSSGSSNGIGNSDVEDYSSAGKVSYAFMSEEELNKELQKREDNLAKRQNALDDIYNGTDRTIQYWEGIVDNAYNIYKQQLERYEVNEELTQQLDEVVGNIDDTESKIDTKDSEISAQECTVSDAQTTYDNAVSTRETLESSLSSLKGASSSDPEKQKEIEAQISRLESEISAAKEAENAALNDLNEAEDKLETLQEEKSELEEQLQGFNEQKDAVEAQIIDAEPNMKFAMKQYNDAKQNFTSQKAKTIENAKNNVAKAQQEVTEFKDVINENKNRDLSIEYSSNLVGKEIIQEALKYLGYNEADGSADKFLYKWHSSSKQVGWCAAFVSYVLEKMPAAKDVPQWYQDIENQYWQVNVHSAARNANAIIDSSEAKMGDLVLYDYDGDGTMQHIGIVVGIEGDKLITIEGNSGNTTRIIEHDLNNPSNPHMEFCKIT